MKTTKKERRFYRFGIGLGLYIILLTFTNNFSYQTTHTLRGLSIGFIIVFLIMLFAEREEEKKSEKEETKDE